MESSTGTGPMCDLSITDRYLYWSWLHCTDSGRLQCGDYDPQAYEDSDKISNNENKILIENN